VIPQWTQPFLGAPPPSGTRPGGKRMTHRFTPGPGSKAREREWHSDSSDLKFKGVCGECNNGWLSDLEAEPSGLVGPMVIGDPVVLYGEGRVTVATWAYKMVLLIQMLRAGVPSQRSVDYRRHDGVP
jgi:hypothetical protein